ncbi:MAG: uncharacterized protein A8A55_3216, partial [Amphiamblys sp. WSBS2006]
RTDERKVFCPYCKEEQGGKAFREEILGVILSLMPHQTLPSLEIRPGMEVKTIMRLPRGNKVSLSNFFVSDALFLRLLSKTVVEITNGMSLFSHSNSLDCCLEKAGEFGERTNKQNNICFDEHTNQEMKQIYENIKTIPKNSIQFIAKEIHAIGSGICVLLKLLDGADGYTLPDILLKSPKEEFIKEFLKEESKSLWTGKVERLGISRYALEILPKLRIHEESVLGKLLLSADHPMHATEILKTENNSIWIGKVRELLGVFGYATGILPKLRIHEENVMELLSLDADKPEHIAEILKTENNSIWIGRMKQLNLRRYAIGILPRFIIHEDTEMEKFSLDAYTPEHIAGILKTENNSIWIGKVRELLGLIGYAAGILPKLRIHEDNEMKTLSLDSNIPGSVAEILKTENKSILVGK